MAIWYPALINMAGLRASDEPRAGHLSQPPDTPFKRAPTCAKSPALAFRHDGQVLRLYPARSHTAPLGASLPSTGTQHANAPHALFLQRFVERYARQCERRALQ